MQHKNTKKALAATVSAVGILYTVSVIGAVTQAQTAAQTAQTRLAASGQAKPIALDGAWVTDPTHTSITFSVRHMVVSQVQGRFDKSSGVIAADSKDISKSSVSFTIQTASIDTNQPQRDAHLKTADFFDAAKYPEITFKSSRIEKKDDGSYVAHGTFTMHGTAKEIDLPFEVAGPIKDAFGMNRFGLHAKLRLNRQDYGVKWNQAMDNGGLVVGNDVDIEINLEAVPK